MIITESETGGIFMENPIENYWKIRLAELKDTLTENNFEVFVAENTEDAKSIVLENIIPGLTPKSVSWGGSITFVATGLYDALKSNKKFNVLDTYDKTLSPDKILEQRRQSLLVDLYITGSNAVTETGQLVNLDMIGNRVGALTFGPKNVIILVGRNKIVPDLEEAMFRIKNYAAPVNTMRLDKKTPCAKTSFCTDCKSPDRICNTWTITEKSFPKKRVKIILINKDLGF
jgi:L-lactate utilization protein LutB